MAIGTKTLLDELRSQIQVDCDTLDHEGIENNSPSTLPRTHFLTRETLHSPESSRSLCRLHFQPGGLPTIQNPNLHPHLSPKPSSFFAD